MNLWILPDTAGLVGEFTFGVNEMTTDGYLAPTTPNPGEDEIGFYLAYESSIFAGSSAGPQAWNKEWDIRTSRALRGSDRTLMGKFRNTSAVVDLTFSFHWRLLVQYG